MLTSLIITFSFELYFPVFGKWKIFPILFLVKNKSCDTGQGGKARRLWGGLYLFAYDPGGALNAVIGLDPFLCPPLSQKTTAVFTLILHQADLSFVSCPDLVHSPSYPRAGRLSFLSYFLCGLSHFLTFPSSFPLYSCFCFYSPIDLIVELSWNTTCCDEHLDMYSWHTIIPCSGTCPLPPSVSVSPTDWQFFDKSVKVLLRPKVLLSMSHSFWLIILAKCVLRGWTFLDPVRLIFCLVMYRLTTG